MIPHAIERLWTRAGKDGLPPLGKMIIMRGEDNRWRLIGRVLDLTDYADLPPDEPNPNPPVFMAQLLAVNDEEHTAMFFDAGEYESFAMARDRILRSFANHAPVRESALARFEMVETQK